MRKIISIFCISIVLFSLVNNVKAVNYKTRSQKEYEAINKAIEDYLSTYMGENVDNYDKILSYHIGTYGSIGGPWKEDEVITQFVVKFSVDVPDKNNSRWLPYVNVLYLDFNYENNEYILERIYDKPDKLDKFEKAFEEYKNTHNEVTNVENIKVSGEKKLSMGEETLKISNTIYIIGIVIISISILVLIIRLKKR